ncbi:DNA polymerase III subunit gamma/tau [Caloranaerobacter azorensis H53214]|uniref:DNA-directed DNA polymerase n=1 Tax=Caloranaerobacter azorensis H53214 TaxID=1156417 RepID=A0A096DNS5_9FIRM|nr:DNA polymerase III subunit gamma/tau [Caloranaerobacter azorensis]KGG80916.1 DNA polymerase III subunit gamma/tau [Caloranaerobacter azorensis H53214]
MAYQALYRKYRPKDFDSVLGQEHVTTILKNQIINNNIAHAYLFSGTRGTGKTSTAKIFARAVNCLNNKDGNPCNECEVCRGILNDTIMDVVEMDAASNNSVDDIRELREKVKYPPSKGRYKVYIIDEVHMLSKGAFNALLKTLEEPPKHLLFILATTEPQKLPATILSRCQRFDFKRISVDDIVKNMRAICDELNIDVEDRGLRLIARNSDGAMRDALSILDQCVSFSDGRITYEYILSILGTVNLDVIFELTDAIINSNLEKTLGLIEDIVRAGKDVNQFIKDLILHFRNLMIAKTSKNIENIIDASDEVIYKLNRQAKNIELNDIMRAIKILSDVEVKAKWSSQPRIILEVGLIKFIKTPSNVDIDNLLEKVAKLEKIIEEGKFHVIDKSNHSYNVEIKTSVSENLKKDNTDQKVNIKDEIFNENGNINSENVSFNKIKIEWSNFLKRLKKEKISIHALLMEGKLISFENNMLTVAFEDGFAFHKDAIEKKNNKEFVEKSISKYFNCDIKMKFIMASEIKNTESEQEDKKKDIIKQIKDIFGEDLVEVV